MIRRINKKRRRMRTRSGSPRTTKDDLLRLSLAGIGFALTKYYLQRYQKGLKRDNKTVKLNVFNSGVIVDLEAIAKIAEVLVSVKEQSIIKALKTTSAL